MDPAHFRHSESLYARCMPPKDLNGRSSSYRVVSLERARFCDIAEPPKAEKGVYPFVRSSEEAQVNEERCVSEAVPSCTTHRSFPGVCFTSP